ncbi:MAG: hypothetical protein AAF441_17175 [Pseudomonadota bacterium]
MGVTIGQVAAVAGNGVIGFERPGLSGRSACDTYHDSRTRVMRAK